MTPAKKFFPNKISLESYDISDLRSDDSTDEDDAPKKKVPTWALGRTNSLKKKNVFQDLIHTNVIFGGSQ